MLTTLDATHKSFHFRYWIMWGACLILFSAVLIYLGTWQLQRADQKRAIIERLDGLKVELSHVSEVVTTELLATTSVRGHYLKERDWLLDNQMFEHQFGYRLLTPFCDDSGCLLVDRGWVSGSLNRKELPHLDTPSGTIELAGRLSDVSENRLITQNEASVTWPRRIQKIVFKDMQSEVPSLIDNRILHLNSGERGVFKPLWQPLSMGPDKHEAYAVQWFSMAAAFVVLMGWIARQRIRPRS